jgi:hypothetical protein
VEAIEENCSVNTIFMDHAVLPFKESAVDIRAFPADSIKMTFKMGKRRSF